MSDFNSDELRNWATVVGAIVALLVFVGNSILHVRHEYLENHLDAAVAQTESKQAPEKPADLQAKPEKPLARLEQLRQKPK